MFSKESTTSQIWSFLLLFNCVSVLIVLKYTYYSLNCNRINKCEALLLNVLISLH